MSARLHLGFAAIAAVACTVPASKGNPELAPKSSATPAVVRGQQGVNVTRLYNDTCGKCHGENAQGGSAKSLLLKDKFDQKWDKPFFDAIKNGVPLMGMEAYGETMSDAEIWALVVHIRELQSRGLAAELAAPKPDAAGVVATQRAKYKVEDVVTDGLRLPWAMDWLPDGKLLVTLRSGTLKLYGKDAKPIGDVTGIPQVRELGQGGLMDVAVPPNYNRTGWVYLSYAEPGEGNTAMTKVVRGKLQITATGAAWTNQQTVYQPPKESFNGAGIHFGSKIVFDGKGHVFFSIGERGGMMLSQDPKAPTGKIFRVNEDGTIPSDNPYPGNGVWSMGHRNPQGLTIDSEGNLWDTEHAPRGGDEMNLIEKGGNYGWPSHSFGINYNDSPFVTPWPKEGENIKMPTLRWLPSIAASGFDTVKGSAFPEWKGDLLAGGLASTVIERVRVKAGKLVETERIFDGRGRVREVAVGPDGFVYVALNGPDKIVRLVPAK